MLKSLNLLIAFLLELVLVVIFGYWGFQAENPLLKILLGVGVPIVVIVMWAVFLAPRSTRRLKGAAYLGLKSLLFVAAALALASAGQPTLAVVFVIIAAVNQILLLVWKQETFGAE